jgi:hypothetical protein
VSDAAIDLGDAGGQGVDPDPRLGDPSRPGGEPLHRGRESAGLHEGQRHRGADGEQREHDHGEPHAADVVRSLDRRRERDHAQRAGSGRLGAERIVADVGARVEPPAVRQHDAQAVPGPGEGRDRAGVDPAAVAQPTTEDHGGRNGLTLEAEADTAHGRHERRVAELAPQPADVGVERLRRPPPVLVPDRRHDLVARHRLAGAHDEERQEIELLRRELELAVAAPRPPRRRVDPDVRHCPLHIAVALAPAQEGAYARGEHRERERLREVVVGARIEAEDLVELRASGGEDEDREIGMVRPCAPADLDAVEVGQTDVEDDEVGRAARQALERRVATGDVLDLVLLARQRADQRLADRIVVLDHQQARHGTGGYERRRARDPESSLGLPNLGLSGTGAWRTRGNHVPMTSTTRKISAAALVAVGVIHLVLSPEYLSEETYIGVLFIAGGLFLCALAAALWRADNVPSWLLGGLTMAGMGIGFVLSRTTGLPGFHESEWELSGVVALALEAGFVAAAIAALRPGRPTAVASSPADDERRFRHGSDAPADRRREADVAA